MNNEIFNEELMRLITKMLANIYYFDCDPVVEIGFCVNCIETLVGRSFSEKETETWFDALKNIADDALNNCI